ncbi:MAG: hypothetical protein ACYDHN_01655 [Solirubrobacteraceae bacterium]
MSARTPRKRLAEAAKAYAAAHQAVAQAETRLKYAGTELQCAAMAAFPRALARTREVAPPVGSPPPPPPLPLPPGTPRPF